MTCLLRSRHGRIDGSRRKACNAFASIMALLTLAASTTWAGSSKSACDLLTIAEAAKVLGAPVTIKKDESGPDDRGGDNCVWATADRRNVMVRIVAMANKDKVPLTYKQEVEQAFGSVRPPETLTGLADEAKYRTYDGNLNGGVVVDRKGTVVFTVEGRTGRENLIDLCRALLSRL